MSTNLGTEYTFPHETIGKQVKKVDHGPFYLYSAGFNIHRVDMRDSVPHIYAGRVTPCTDWVVRLLEEQAAPDCIVMRDFERDSIGNLYGYAYNLMSADEIRNAILDEYAYGHLGTIELTTFRHMKPAEFQLDFFNSLVRPFVVEPGEATLRLAPEIVRDIEEIGGLAVRKRLVEDAAKRIEGSEFLSTKGASLQLLYLAAIQEISNSFNIARQYGMNELTAADNEIQRSMNGSSDAKENYSRRDRYIQWLLARKPVNEALATLAARQQNAQPVVVQVPPQAPGITRDDIIAIVQAVMQANQAQQILQSAPMKTEEVVQAVEELVLPKAGSDASVPKPPSSDASKK